MSGFDCSVYLLKIVFASGERNKPPKLREKVYKPQKKKFIIIDITNYK